MRYFLAIFLPPLAVLSTWRPIAFLLNLVLVGIGFATFGLGIFAAIVHALLVVNRYYADQRNAQLIAAAYTAAAAAESARTVVYVQGPPAPRKPIAVRPVPPRLPNVFRPPGSQS